MVGPQIADCRYAHPSPMMCVPDISPHTVSADDLDSGNPLQLQAVDGARFFDLGLQMPHVWISRTGPTWVSTTAVYSVEAELAFQVLSGWPLHCASRIAAALGLHSLAAWSLRQCWQIALRDDS